MSPPEIGVDPPMWGMDCLLPRMKGTLYVKHKIIIICKKLGSQLIWNQMLRIGTITLKDMTIILQSGNPRRKKNGKGASNTPISQYS